LKIFPLAIAGLAGGSMALQGVLNSILGKKIGEFEATFIVHVIASGILGIILLLGVTDGSLRNVPFVPWFGFLGGPLSVIIIWGVLASVGRVGAASATTAIVTVQILTALGLDLLGITGEKVPISGTTVLGAVILIIGAYLLLKRPA